ncbi:MAG: tRNA uridine-5-carboxymethylaminomethyl(34) synthesis GTPase MnmE [Clostridia bacterium]|nr:tRNA uridine-5-carboxymethylaminomethyl(34) synthesis GTPase MnmE [Clostridia bacterium]
MKNSTTVAAISTPVAAGGIGVIRISGDEAVDIVSKIFVPSGKKIVADMKGYTAAHGIVYDGDKAIDEAVLLVFRAPHSYTGEDVAEISCHGGVYVVSRVLRAVLAAGALPAAPGEFTKRAFLNGKLDLTKAEAVMSLISAQGEQSAGAAMTALEGALSKKIIAAAQTLITDSAYLAAWVDYPDDEIEEISTDKLLADYKNVLSEIESLLNNYDAGRAITEGVDTVIAGKPNVGKSTLMNFLAGFRRSIVTDIAGTTRDVVEDTVRLGNVVLHLADTAGIRETGNEVEKIGVDFAVGRVERAALVLAVFDLSREFDNEDKAVLELCKNKCAVAVINKDDLEPKFDLSVLDNFKHIVYISAKDGKGAEKLAEAVESALGTNSVDTSAALLANERQRLCCEKAADCIREAISALEMNMTLDAVTVSTDSAINELLTLTGEKATDAVINEVFSRFCVGK